ncbi:digalactosyldiacylglycerol synthase 1, chloroplastic [Nymphaea colorata]|nr:digalactosyldiacylglycerol synthase 1, chloroplastic [Nymphaea colorata]
MAGVGEQARPSSAATAEGALSFISRGWREVRDGAGADIRLMRARASSFRSLASSFEEELENLLTRPPSAVSLVKRLEPKLSEFRRAYSSPDFSAGVLGGWSPGSSGFDFSGLRSALGVEDENGRAIVELDERPVRRRRVSWKGEAEESSKEWEPIRLLKLRLKEFEHKASSSNLRGIELIEKFRKGLETINKDTSNSKEVAPLDVSELLAYLVKQSGPIFDQLGLRRDMCDKLVDALRSRRKDQLVLNTVSTGELPILSQEENEKISDELDCRVSSVLQSTGYCYDGALWTDAMNKDTDTRKPHVAIVTTASLPWMTGTAINPLFRAAYLAKSAQQNVTLLVPWLCKSDQQLVYPDNLTFNSPIEQEAYIRKWLEARIGFKADFQISFYPGKFHKERRSIIPAGDTSQFISSREADIAILEEPEHLNWYHHGKRWTDKFNYVVGVVHTNYLEYIKREKNGALQAFFVKHINNLVARAYCNKVLRLSAATQDLPKSVVCNVHGVNPKFLKVGEKLAADRELGQKVFSKGAYFLGKMVWAKGYRELIDLLSKHRTDLDGFNLDVYGNGEDSNEVQSTARRLNLNMNFLKGRDHADDTLHGYKIFINPSVSDVLCTATAEALAMGKFVICADHPSNEFFRAFPNCLTYRTSEEFVERVKEAMARDPLPLTAEQRYNLSWEAATQRFIEYAELGKFLNNSEKSSSRKGPGRMTKSISMPSLSDIVDGSLAFSHYCLTGNELLRLSTGAMPKTRDYSEEHCMDLHLLPPQVENPIYGW